MGLRVMGFDAMGGGVGVMVLVWFGGSGVWGVFGVVCVVDVWGFCGVVVGVVKFLS